MFCRYKTEKERGSIRFMFWNGSEPGTQGKLKAVSIPDPVEDRPAGHTGPAAADGLCQGLGGLRRGFWSVVPVCLNKCGKNSVQVHGAVEIQAADRGDGKAGAGQPDPPLDGLAANGDHGMGVVYDLNEIHEPGIVNGHIPAHTIGKGRGQGKGMGRPCQSAGLVDPLKQRVGVIPVDVIPGNIRGYVLAEQMPVVGRELVAVDVLEPVFAGRGQIWEAGDCVVVREGKPGDPRLTLPRTSW